MSEDKAPFLAAVGRTFGDDEVCYVSYVLSKDACVVSSSSHDHVFYLLFLFPVLEDGEYFFVL